MTWAGERMVSVACWLMSKGCYWKLPSNRGIGRSPCCVQLAFALGVNEERATPNGIGLISGR
jgi:hypothetical protein